MTPTNEAGHGLPDLPEPYLKAEFGRSALFSAYQMQAYARFCIAEASPSPDLIHRLQSEIDDHGKAWITGAELSALGARDALALSRGVPADMVLVPVEPTEAMLSAMDMCLMAGPEDAYRAMLAAAPAAAGAQGEDWFGDVLASAGEVIPMQSATLSDAALIAGWEAKAASYDRLGPEEDGGDPTGDKAKTLRDCASELRSRIALQLAPQPAAADGGVRARQLLAAELRNIGYPSSAGELAAGASVEDKNVLGAALRAIEAALSSHRQAGDDLSKLADATRALLHAVCGETGFAAAVRANSGLAYPWPALDIAEERARSVLALVEKGAGNG